MFSASAARCSLHMRPIRIRGLTPLRGGASEYHITLQKTAYVGNINPLINPTQPSTTNLPPLRPRLDTSHAFRAQWPQTPRKRDDAMYQLKTLNHRHLAIIDWILANPDRTLGDCSRALGFSQSWMSQVIASDLFRDEFERRRQGLEEQEHREIIGKLRTVAKGTLDAISTRIQNGEDCSDQLLIQGGQAALRALGYSGNAGPRQTNIYGNVHAGPTQINNGAVDADTMRQAREIYKKARGHDHDTTDDSGAGERERLPSPERLSAGAEG